LAHIRPAANK